MALEMEMSASHRLKLGLSDFTHHIVTILGVLPRILNKTLHNLIKKSIFNHILDNFTIFYL